MNPADALEFQLQSIGRMVLMSLIRASFVGVAREAPGHETDSVLSRYNITGKSDFAGAARKPEG